MKLTQWTCVILCGFLVTAVAGGRIHNKKHLKSKYKLGPKGRQCGYEGCPVPKPGLINVHLIPHSHDDVGWLKTVDQYYYGSRSNIQKAGVQYILDSVVQELLTDPEKRFIYAESAFFFKWWDEQTDKVKQQVKLLVQEGRLEFIGGAWSMNDEATVHYQSVVDQFTWGLRQLNDTFGQCGRPTVGWQIDPFGHAKEMASLFAEMGYDGLFFGRIDYQDKDIRMDEKTGEFLWRANQNLGASSDLFSGVLYNQYQAPSGFCWDILCSDEPIIDDKESPDYNVERRVDEFARYLRTQAQYFASDNLIVTMGGDFTYQAAHQYFLNMDKMIRYSNQRQINGSDINLFYSTPACYLKSLHDANITWTTKSDDFFPYASDPHAYWSGYFTSRPTIKRFERIGNQFLQICKQLSVLSPKKTATFEQNLSHLREAMGIMQHHDAITGTEKQHVSDDYARILTEAIGACTENTNEALDALTQVGTQDHHSRLDYQSCLFLNISQCDVSENSDSFVVTIYNPLSYSDYQYVRIPVPAALFTIRDYRGVEVNHTVDRIPQSLIDLSFRNSNSSHELVFLASELPPLGYKSYFISRRPAVEPEVFLVMDEPQTKDNSFTIENKNIKLSFDDAGLLASITANGITRNVTQNYFYYEGAVGNNAIFANRSSGAYIFRPNSSAILISDKVTNKILESPDFQEVHQVFNEWISQVIRLYTEENYVEIQWQVGGIPIDDGIGKEVIIRFDTEIASNGTFETDSNGRQMIRRVRNQRDTWNVTLNEPIAGNYFPVTTKIALQDNSSRFAILTDRAQGGSSLKDGSLELMLHRRLLRDDAFGVGEALNEQAYGKGLVARGQIWLVFGNPNDKSPSLVAQERILQQRKLYAGWLFLADVSNISFDHWSEWYKGIFSGLSASLPQNVNLMTLEPWKDDGILVRFEHLLELNEDPELSKNVTFNLQDIFRTWDIVEVRETTLAANQWLSDAKRFKFRTNDERIVGQKNTVYSMADGVDAFVPNEQYPVTLAPMQIRTFILTIDWKP